MEVMNSVKLNEHKSHTSSKHFNVKRYTRKQFIEKRLGCAVWTGVSFGGKHSELTYQANCYSYRSSYKKKKNILM